MEQIWTEMYQAAKEILKPRDVSKRIEAGGVAAAVECMCGHSVYTWNLRRTECNF